MKKFFLFKRRPVNLTSTTTSDTGEGIDILAVSVDQIAFITASLGKVNIVFNDATIYEDSNLLDGESFKKTSVTVACEAGGEADLIDSIMGFISSDRVKTNVMRFDAVEGKTNVKEASIGAFTDVVSQISQNPVDRATQKVSKRTFIGGTAGTAFGTGYEIEGINFGSADNLPSIDFNETNFTETASVLTGWTNDSLATGGSTYDISAPVGSIAIASAGRAEGGLSVSAPKLVTGQYMPLGAVHTITGEFTMYAVLGIHSQTILARTTGYLYKGNDANSFGVQSYPNLGHSSSQLLMAFDDSTKENILVDAPTVFDWDTPEDERRTCSVVIIRRDTSDNLFFHDYTGSIFAQVLDMTSESEESNYAVGGVGENSSSTYDTRGDFSVKMLGSNSGKSSFTLGRIGVIPRDIGTANASELAINLYDKYRPTN